MATTIVVGKLYNLKKDFDNNQNPRIVGSLSESVKGSKGKGTLWYFIQVYGANMNVFQTIMNNMAAKKCVRPPQVQVIGELQTQVVDSGNPQYTNYKIYQTKAGSPVLTVRSVQVVDWGTDYSETFSTEDAGVIDDGGSEYGTVDEDEVPF